MILLLVRLVVEFLVERQFNIIKIAGESAITRSADRCAGNEGEKKSRVEARPDVICEPRSWAAGTH
ncbi:hypothetical protein H3V53_35660 [Paraburkholderia bengalensis]|uniref:Uncharacterized protein n=1 Tax=Paraburkholderia bengalensis TaxID=2747562 RepID=A0ABU8J3C7_9BURK